MNESNKTSTHKQWEELHPGIDPDWCYICDRPKNDCACVENGGTY